MSEMAEASTSAGSRRRSRSAKNMRMKRSMKGKYRGRKERLKEEVKALQADKEECLLKNSKLSTENLKLQRYSSIT